MNIIKQTFREALKTPGFSLLYIGGVAFTIAFTVIYGTILYGQLGSVYPEYDRPETYYIKSTTLKNTNYTMNSGIGKPFIDEFLRGSMKSVDKVTVVTNYNPGYPMVQTDGRGSEFHVEQRMTEPSFFDFYKYKFLAGRPFSQDEFDAKERVAVISDKVAAKLFDSPEKAVGEKISINHSKYRITGVFREGSALNVDSYGEVFVPYNFTPGTPHSPIENYAGGFSAIVKVKPGKSNLFRQELNEITRRLNAIDTTADAPKFIIPDVPSHAEHILSPESGNRNDDDSETYAISEPKSKFELAKPFIMGLLVLLIIPALNISGLIGARMDRMQAEIGVRRCYGATKSGLMTMVLTQNLVLTLAGGLLGLLVAWLISFFAGNLLANFMPLGYSGNSSFGQSASFVTSEMAFAPALFLLTLIFCLVLNIISAWIPARRTLNKQITTSLNSKR